MTHHFLVVHPPTDSVIKPILRGLPIFWQSCVFLARSSIWPRFTFAERS